ncbi:MAG: superoxide dismutase, Fe-Mn family [Planctomycetota bacterium]|nr:superoxide dismutase, Fe-Mn family [Planctomycetota bacterium]
MRGGKSSISCKWNHLRFIIIFTFIFVPGLSASSVQVEGKRLHDQEMKGPPDIMNQQQGKGNSSMKSQGITKHVLPSLPYDYNELEPYYDEETLRLHHDKHHAAYVNGLNEAEEKLAEARRTGNYALIRYLEQGLAFNGSGHILHSIFWTNMAPNLTGTERIPKGQLADQIKQDFGSFDIFKKQFSEAAIKVEGNGWTILGWVPEFNKLVVLQAENHQKLTLWGAVPLLVLDVWEHAYYLKFQNRRSEWVENWWNIVNWDNVANRFEKVCQ